MTKNEYLIELAMKLQKLTEDARAIYPELKSLIEFYQEMLDDKIEDGMTEEEAVAAMETPDEIVMRLKSEFGEMRAQEAGARAEDGGSVTSRSEGARAMVRREYSPDKVKTVRIVDENHALSIVRGDKVAVSYQNDQEGEYEAELADGVLTITYKRDRRSFFRNIFGSWKQKTGEVTLELPRNWEGTADVRTSNAAITAREIAISELKMRSCNGRIVLDEVTCGNITGVTSNGVIQLEKITGEYAELKTSNGRISAQYVCAKVLKLTGSNGSVNVQDITVTELAIKTSNGSIKMQDVTGGAVRAATSNSGIMVENVAGEDITLVTSNGSVTGTICGKQSDYAITSGTSNGSNNLPNGAGGAKRLDVRTSNAKIAVEFADNAGARE